MLTLAPANCLPRDRLLSREQRLHFRLGWNDDPGEQVSDDAGAGSGGEGEEDAEDAHEGYVEIEVVSQAGADAGDFFVGPGAHQSLGCALGGGRNAHRLTAVGAEVNVLRDIFAASVAEHRLPFWN